MKKTIVTLALALLALAGFSGSGSAGVDINIGIALPPPVVVSAPPELVVIPGTYVYVAPDVSVDVFFYQGYWWRPWKGHWYRSHTYREGWVVYKNPPSVLVGIPPGWRVDYKNHHWKGQEWHYTRVSHREVAKNWKDWEKGKHWDQPQYRQVRGPQKQDVKSQDYGKPETKMKPEVQQGPDTHRGPQGKPSENHKKDK